MKSLNWDFEIELGNFLVLGNDVFLVVNLISGNLLLIFSENQMNLWSVCSEKSFFEKGTKINFM